MWILVALREEPRNVVRLLDDVRALDGRVGPGTFYGAVARLERLALIEPTRERRWTTRVSSDRARTGGGRGQRSRRGSVMTQPFGELGRFAEPSLYILVSLSDGPKHGYAIMTDVEEISGSPLGPGTLYGALARLERRGLIEALEPEDRRRPYRLTGAWRDDGRGPARKPRRLRSDRPPPPHERSVMSRLVAPLPARLARALRGRVPQPARDRPPSLGDRFDIVRGAVDARLHPQVRRSVNDAPPTSESEDDLRFARRLGIGALVGAGLWPAALGIVLMGPVVYDGQGAYRDGSASFPVWFAATALIALGMLGQVIRLPPTARVARFSAAAAIPAILIFGTGPWLWMFGLAAVVLMVVLALGGLHAGTWPGWASLDGRRRVPDRLRSCVRRHARHRHR